MIEVFLDFRCTASYRIKLHARIPRRVFAAGGGIELKFRIVFSTMWQITAWLTGGLVNLTELL